jgi:hypothetical protein
MVGLREVDLRICGVFNQQFRRVEAVGAIDAGESLGKQMEARRAGLGNLLPLQMRRKEHNLIHRAGAFAFAPASARRRAAVKTSGVEVAPASSCTSLIV